MLVIAPKTQEFVDGLNEKFGDTYTFSAMPGRKYDRIVATYVNDSKARHVHAFIDAEGNIYKSAGWSAPAKGVRYTSVAAALEVADKFGSYLYAR